MASQHVCNIPKSQLCLHLLTPITRPVPYRLLRPQRTASLRCLNVGNDKLTSSHPQEQQSTGHVSYGNVAFAKGVGHVAFVRGVAAESMQKTGKGFITSMQRWLSTGKLDRKRMAALGFGAFSAYGVISNINAGVLITIAWISVVKATGQIPFAEGNWPKFLAVYGGLWISSHFMRPIRLSLAIAAAPAFDAALTRMSKATSLNKVGAFAIMLVGIAVGTISLLGSVIWLCGGFPANAVPKLA